MNDFAEEQNHQKLKIHRESLLVALQESEARTYPYAVAYLMRHWLPDVTKAITAEAVAAERVRVNALLQQCFGQNATLETVMTKVDPERSRVAEGAGMTDQEANGESEGSFLDRTAYHPTTENVGTEMTEQDFLRVWVSQSPGVGDNEWDMIVMYSRALAAEATARATAAERERWQQVVTPFARVSDQMHDRSPEAYTEVSEEMDKAEDDEFRTRAGLPLTTSPQARSKRVYAIDGLRVKDWKTLTAAHRAGEE